MRIQLAVGAVGLCVAGGLAVLWLASTSPKEDYAREVARFERMPDPIVRVPASLPAAATWLADHRRKHPLPAGLFDQGESARQQWNVELWETFHVYLDSLDPYLDMLGAGLDTPKIETRGDAEAWLRDLHGILLARAQYDRSPRRAAGYAALAHRWGRRVRLPYLSGTRVRRALLSGPAAILRKVHARRGFDAVAYRTVVDRLLLRAERKQGPRARALREERARRVSRVPGMLARKPFDTAGGRAALLRNMTGYLRLVQEAIDACDTSPGQAHATSREFAADTEIVSHFAGYARFVSDLRATRVALAYLAHRQKTGAWPALIPAPPDPLTQEPFAFKDGRLTPQLGPPWPLARK